jgi:hypothetical protein
VGVTKLQKMRNTFLLLLLGLSLSFTACDNGESAAQEAAFKTMMDVHDEVMPKMGEINRLSRELKALETAADNTNRDLLGEIDGAIRALEKADQGMMGWMNMNGGNKLAKLQEEMSHDEIMAYIKAEEENILQVKEDMLTSIEQGKRVLEKIGQE